MGIRVRKYAHLTLTRRVVTYPGGDMRDTYYEDAEHGVSIRGDGSWWWWRNEHFDTLKDACGFAARDGLNPEQREVAHRLWKDGMPEEKAIDAAVLLCP